MAIIPKTTGIHHICLRSTDMRRSKDFYQNTIGFPLIIDEPDLMIFLAGAVFVAFKKADPKTGTFFSPFEIGLDHIALACSNEEELYRFAKELTEAQVENTGVKRDEVLQKLYVAFKDPDKIQWEFYMI